MWVNQAWIGTPDIHNLGSIRRQSRCIRPIYAAIHPDLLRGAPYDSTTYVSYIVLRATSAMQWKNGLVDHRRRPIIVNPEPRTLRHRAGYVDMCVPTDALVHLVVRALVFDIINELRSIRRVVYAVVRCLPT